MERNKLLTIIGVILIAIPFLLNSAHADSITTPLNNSILSFGHSYNFTIDITHITNTTTSDIASLYINNSLVYQNTFTANGLYKVPIQFNNYGTFNVSLKTSEQSGILYYNYSVPKPIPSGLSNDLNMSITYFNYFFFIIVLWVIAFLLGFFVLKGIGIKLIKEFLYLVVGIISFVILITTYTTSINQFVYYIAIVSFGVYSFIQAIRFLSAYI
jgi:hypothetical protein